MNVNMTEPRPTPAHVNDDPLITLRHQLSRLHRQAGEPSLREIAALTHRAVSHTTVGQVLKCERVPSWGHTEVVVEALGGDTAAFKQLWVATRDAEDPPHPPPLAVDIPSVLDSGSDVASVARARDSHDDQDRIGKGDPWASISVPLIDVSTNYPWTARLTRDGRLLAIGGGNGLVQVWESDTGRVVGEPLAGHIAVICAIAFSWDGQRLATGDSDGTVRLWNTRTGCLVGAPIPSQSAGVTAMSFSQQGLLAIGSEKGVICWDPDAGHRVGRLVTGHTGRVLAVAFSPDERLMAIGSSDGTVRLWDSVTGLPTTDPMIGHTGPVISVAFSPDGQSLAAAGGVTVRLWNPITGLSTAGPMIDRTGPVYAVAFSPDGQLLATGNSDKTVRLWNVGDGSPASEPLTDVTGGVVLALAYSADGRRLASVRGDGTVRLSRRA